LSSLSFFYIVFRPLHSIWLSPISQHIKPAHLNAGSPITAYQASPHIKIQPQISIEPQIFKLDHKSKILHPIHHKILVQSQVQIEPQIQNYITDCLHRISNVYSSLKMKPSWLAAKQFHQSTTTWAYHRFSTYQKKQPHITALPCCLTRRNQGHQTSE
jgi:hypothetical protein